MNINVGHKKRWMFKHPPFFIIERNYSASGINNSNFVFPV